MKRLFLALFAATLFVGCASNMSEAEAGAVENKATLSDIADRAIYNLDADVDAYMAWYDMLVVENAEKVDAKTVEAAAAFDAHFDAWYDSLTNTDIKELAAARTKFEAAYAEAVDWYNRLSDDEQQGATKALAEWEEENFESQATMIIFAVKVADMDVAAIKEKGVPVLSATFFE